MAAFRRALARWERVIPLLKMEFRRVVLEFMGLGFGTGGAEFTKPHHRHHHFCAPWPRHCSRCSAYPQS